VAGKLVSTRRLNAALCEVEELNAGAGITLFEITTAAAFKLFSERPADYLLLETGMGGIHDTTNVVDRPLGTIITPIDFDHQEFLGRTLVEISISKAGILKRGSRAVMGLQCSEARAVLARTAQDLDILPIWQGRDFDGQAERGQFHYSDTGGVLHLPAPALPGPHQFDNAALAIAAARHFELPVDAQAIAEGLRRVVWPARMQPIEQGALRRLLPAAHEVWLDGGHNPHGALALARTIAGLPRRPLVLIMGMMSNRDPALFLEPFHHLAPQVVLTLAIPGERNAHKASTVAARATALGFRAHPARSLASALTQAARIENARVLICGSLYLAGHVLAKNGTVPV
jgi:dihydrofolate synthase/folylpolyglutamate synthase